LAQFDPQAALGVQSTRQSMRIQEQQAQQAYAAANRAAQGWAQQQDQATRAAAAEQIERALAMGTQAQTPEQWDQVMQSVGAADYVGQFGNRQMLIAGALGLRDALTMGQGGPEFRAATPEEAAQFGAAGGQFGPDGRFYPINPPSGMTVETMPGGGVRMVQGAGVGGSPTFTEGQSRDNVYATRARGALERFEPVANSLMSRGEAIAEMVPLGLARGAQTSEYQTAVASGDEFIQAILRKDTGAALTVPEMAEYRRVYLPQPGDTPEVLEVRREARARALAALEAGMGEAQRYAQARALAETIQSVASGGGSVPMTAAPQPQTPTPRPAPTPAQAQPAIPAEASQAGVTPELWSIMTPEERAVFE
jgi:hypothetical protein